MRSLFKLTLAAGLAALAFPLQAGEITGNDEPIDLQGQSICAASGQNDGNPPPGRTQSFGQTVRVGSNDPTTMDPDFEGPFLPHPGWACNPHNVTPPWQL